MNNKVEETKFFKPIKSIERIQFLDDKQRLDVWSTKKRVSIGVNYEKLKDMDEIINFLKQVFDNMKDPLTEEDLTFIREKGTETYANYISKTLVKRTDDVREVTRY